jgi:hypothetical protein
MPLTSYHIRLVLKLLASGMRHADIARRLELSVWTIARIADGRRRCEPSSGFGAQEEAEEGRCELAGDALAGEIGEDDAPPDYDAKNLRRCPGCGAMVYLWPCIACRHGVSTPAIAPRARCSQP